MPHSELPTFVRPNLQVISNKSPIKAPAEPTFVENTLLFLPPNAVRELKLEPNMDDKGDLTKTLWFGRVWELRALLGAQRQASIDAKMKQRNLTVYERQALDDRINNAMKDPRLAKKLRRVASTWTGAIVRIRSNLKFLDKLAYSYLRGTVVYAHGSGGCSWDNFRICRMMCRMGMLVIAPDGFAYPPSTGMGKLRHKELQPLKTADDNVDYWENDLVYVGSAKGSLTYSTDAKSVLDDPVKYREMYENSFRLRSDELHWIIGRLPQWIRAQGFFIGGTSEGAMTVCRFDDHRYEHQVLGRFINSFSIEYCYFTPTEDCAKVGGQLDVPTLNIIGTHDEYFGAKDSVAQLVKDDGVSGYGDVKLDGHGFDQMIFQEVDVGLVCLLQEGKHGPCPSHDNFLRCLFQDFFTRPMSVSALPLIWEKVPYKKDMMKIRSQRKRVQKLTIVDVPKMLHPSKLTLSEIDYLVRARNFDLLNAHANEQEKSQAAERHKIVSGLRTMASRIETLR